MMILCRCAAVAAVLACVLLSVSANAGEPLRVSRDNPRYFADAQGQPVYLTGSHTWPSLVDMGPADPPPAFPFDEYVAFLKQHRHNFVRLWTWESAAWNTEANNQKTRHSVQPLCFARTGPGTALDGKPKFDVTKFDEAYFNRLRERVAALAAENIYVSVMLFEGWALQHDKSAWLGHPLHASNNINGLDGDPDGDGRGIETHTLANPALTRIQEAYVRKVIDTVNAFDNVLYEIANESGAYSTEWQYHLIRFIKEYEKTKPKQHPVGMTFQYARDKAQRGSNRLLFESPADWISPNPDGGYRDDPPAADGSKVILNDTDHLWGIGGNQAWVWKSFCRGLNPLFMDPYDGTVLGPGGESKWGPVRRSMGHTRQFAERLRLAAVQPLDALASTGYCLANPGVEYLVYLPEGGAVRVDLSAAPGPFAAEWFDPTKGTTASREQVDGGTWRELKAPFSGDAVLFLKAKS